MRIFKILTSSGAKTATSKAGNKGEEEEEEENTRQPLTDLALIASKCEFALCSIEAVHRVYLPSSKSVTLCRACLSGVDFVQAYIALSK